MYIIILNNFMYIYIIMQRQTERERDSDIWIVFTSPKHTVSPIFQPWLDHREKEPGAERHPNSALSLRGSAHKTLMFIWVWVKILKHYRLRGATDFSMNMY